MLIKKKGFQENIPLISTLCNPGIRPRHWEKISAIYGDDLTPDAGTTLRKTLKKNLDQYMEQFETISAAASKVIYSVLYRIQVIFFYDLFLQEFSLEKALDRMQVDWNDIEFNTLEYRDSGVKILAGLDDVQTMLDDQIVKTQTMRGSPFIKPFEVEIKVSPFKLKY